VLLGGVFRDRIYKIDRIGMIDDLWGNGKRGWRLLARQRREMLTQSRKVAKEPRMDADRRIANPIALLCVGFIG